MPSTPERSLGQLIAAATEDISALIRGEVALAKSELKVSVGAGLTGAGLFAGAAFVALLAVILLTITMALGLEELGLPGWLSFLIVAVFLLLIGVVLGLLGRRSFKKVGPPRRTIASVQDAKEILHRSDVPAVHASRD
jgi:Putative Actinobacterial Holin-X, holin superfamily III